MDKIKENIKIEFSDEYVGTLSNHPHNDYYVYVWYIVDSGEIFYVGKGRGTRYKDPHKHAIYAEKIKSKYITNVKIIADNLTEDQALKLETQEMLRILNHTSYVLTNIITPSFANRSNGYTKSKKTPPLSFETAPVIYVNEINEHYFDMQHRVFDRIVDSNLSSVYLIEKKGSDEEVEILYKNNYIKYYNDIVFLLKKNGSKILKTKYAKSVTAWVYPFEEELSTYLSNEENAKNKLGHQIPAYHLIDLWKHLSDKHGHPVLHKSTPISIHPKNNRVPLEYILNLNDPGKGYTEGSKYWSEGEQERKKGNIERAIKLFDIARYNGYDAPALYHSYAVAYRKINDLDNEIDILNEVINRYSKNQAVNTSKIIQFEKQRERAYARLIAKSEKNF